MRALFLDVDGVLNRLGDKKHRRTEETFRGCIGLDTGIVLLYEATIAKLNVEVVLSSTWRLTPEHREHLSENGIRFVSTTPKLRDPGLCRGHEIAAWLMEHSEIERYAILDDDGDMLPHQLPNFFQTDPRIGLTKKIADRVAAHLSR